MAVRDVRVEWRMPAASPATTPGLARVLGPWTATAIVVGTVIGTGVFIVPAEVARSAGSLSIVLLAWVAGGALSLFGALTYAELGAAIPEAGGEYAFIGRAFGERWAYRSAGRTRCWRGPAPMRRWLPD